MTEQLNISTRSILSVAVPISLGTFVQFVVSFTDNYFVAQLDGNAMSAVSFIGLMYISLSMIGVGLSNAAQILIARRKGEGNHTAVGEVLGNSIRLAWMIAAIQFVLLFFIVPLSLDVFVKHDGVAVYMQEFIEYRAIGFFFYTLTLVLNAFWSGIAQTRVMIYTTVITALVNILLDYGLIFGHLGMPKLGVTGAALATILSEIVGFLFVLIYTWRHSDAFHKDLKSASYEVRKWLWKGTWKYSSALVRLGGPISMQLVLSLGVWVIFYGFIESMGESELHASFIVRQLYMLAFISIGGFSTTTKTYISGLITENRQAELPKVMKRLMLLNFLGVLFLSHGLWLYPEFIAGQFATNPITIEQTVKTMYIVLPAMLTFSITSILLGTVEGSGNTFAGFMVELLTVIVYLIVAYLMVFKWTWPIHLVWTVDYLYFGLIGLFSWAFLYNGKWKYKKV
ncbi:MAG TPA: MATE family efflux transporter [Flavobacteriales bacterium]